MPNIGISARKLTNVAFVLFLQNLDQNKENLASNYQPLCFGAINELMRSKKAITKKKKKVKTNIDGKQRNKKGKPTNIIIYHSYKKSKDTKGKI